ncbi:MAG: Tab2/Atab2 family RNA-binding protein [Synechococcus sp.]|nr:Tab2/Atab2 family RNA-binding protein [Synechococcus sp.]
MSAANDVWELDYYSRPLLDENGKKRWELLLSNGDGSFRWQRFCAASSVNSVWLKEALGDALAQAHSDGASPPRRLRCWRSSMRTMVQRAAEQLGLEMVPSRRCYALVEWLMQREAEVYPAMDGFMNGPLAPPAMPLQPLAIPLPEAVRGDSWGWANLPVASLAEAAEWPMDFSGLVPLPASDGSASVPGLRLFSRSRSLALAGWLSGLEPVRLEVSGRQLVLEAGMEDRWLVSDLADDEASSARQAFEQARQQAGGLQFLAVQSSPEASEFAGFWLLRDLPDV